MAQGGGLDLGEVLSAAWSQVLWFGGQVGGGGRDI